MAGLSVPYHSVSSHNLLFPRNSARPRPAVGLAGSGPAHTWITNMNKRTVTRLSTALLAVVALGCADDYNFTEPDNPLIVTPAFIGIEEGQTTQLTATVGGEPAAVTWSSDDPSILTVSSTGLVTSLKAGTTGVIATLVADATKTRSSSVTVIAFPVLTSGTPVANLSSSAPRGTMAFYTINVPAGTTNLTVTLAGGTGDVDLYLRHDLKPTYDDNACASFNGGNDEECSIDNPTPGRWFMALDLWEAYAGVTLEATITP